MVEFEMEKRVKKKYRSHLQTLSCFECMPARLWICFMMFTATWMVYTCRLQLGSILPVMTGSDHNKTRNVWDISSNTTFYQWDDQTVRKWTMFAYGVGNVPGNLLGGTLSISLGPRAVIFWTSLVAAIASILSPVAANIHWVGLVILRLIVGGCGGVVFPACHTMVSAWAPPAEKSRFIWSLLGGTAGSIAIYPMLGVLSARFGWESAWIVPSVVYLCWLACWLIWAYNTPADHPFISDEEKTYISQSQSGLGRSEKLLVKEMPLGAIFTSAPFLALVVCHFGNLYLLFFYQNYMITYLSKARGANIEKSGFIAAFPWLCRVIMGFFFSWAGDIVKNKKYVSLTVFRKIATIFSHLIPGICLILVGHISDIFLANIVLCVALGCNGAASIANLTNNQDLSPNYAGFLYGVMNFFGTTSAVFQPFIVEAIVDGQDKNPEKWQQVFYAGGGVCVTSMLFFVLLGSAEIQPWNNPNHSRSTA